MIWITPSLSIDEDKLDFRFIRSSGPGGQNVNKVSTAVQLRFNLTDLQLPEEMRQRLIAVAGNRLTEDGVLIIEAKDHRTQEQNREEAVRRLVGLLRRSAEKPKPRTPTKPSHAARQKRLDVKHRRGQVKSMRRSPAGSDE